MKSKKERQKAIFENIMEFITGFAMLVGGLGTFTLGILNQLIFGNNFMLGTFNMDVFIALTIFSGMLLTMMGSYLILRRPNEKGSKK